MNLVVDALADNLGISVRELEPGLFRDLEFVDGIQLDNHKVLAIGAALRDDEACRKAAA